MHSFRAKYFFVLLTIFGFDLSANPMTMSEIARIINLPEQHKAGQNVKVAIVEVCAPKEFVNVSGQTVPVSDGIKAVQDQVPLKPLEVEVNQVVVTDISKIPENLGEANALVTHNDDAEWMRQTAKSIRRTAELSKDCLDGACSSSRNIRYDANTNKLIVLDAICEFSNDHESDDKGGNSFRLVPSSESKRQLKANQQELMALTQKNASLVVNLIGDQPGLVDPDGCLKNAISAAIDNHNRMIKNREKCILKKDEYSGHAQDVFDLFHHVAPKANYAIYSTIGFDEIANSDARIVSFSTSARGHFHDLENRADYFKEICENSIGKNQLIVVALENEDRAISDVNFLQKIADMYGVSVIFVSQHEGADDGQEVSEFLPKESDIAFRSHFMTAPGLEIELPRDKSVASGSSFSTPIVSAAAAIVLSHYPDLTAAELKRILVESGTKNLDNPHDPKYRNTVNVGAALEMAAGLKK